MLNWSNLNQSKRLLCSFFSLVAALFIVAPFFASPFTWSGALAGIAVGLCMFSVLLNPASVQGSSEALLWSKQPKICQALLAVAGTALMVRSAIALLS